jgi:uncharacterized membrane protein YtjA (UPF0391 family)
LTLVHPGGTNTVSETLKAHRGCSASFKIHHVLHPIAATENRRFPFGIKDTYSGVVSMGNILHWAVVFLVVALISAFLGFGGVAGTAMEGARLLFWVAIVFLVISLVLGFIRRA